MSPAVSVPAFRPSQAWPFDAPALEADGIGFFRKSFGIRCRF